MTDSRIWRDRVRSAVERVAHTALAARLIRWWAPETDAIQVRLAGGLGNQMFQFAAGFALAERHRTALVLDQSGLASTVAGEGSIPRDYALDLFALPASCRATLQPGWRKWVAHRFQERSMRYDPAFARVPAGSYLAGYWQSAAYFRGVEDRLRAIFWLAAPPGDAALADEIAAGESVCVHVRRRDFVHDPTIARIHGACDAAYYRAASAELHRLRPAARFFVFSDDVEWCRTADLAGGLPARIVSGDAAGRDGLARDLALMTRCRHFILANSSFGWWAAWLGHHPDSVTVAPDPWFADPALDASDLVPEHWLRRPARGAKSCRA